MLVPLLSIAIGYAYSTAMEWVVHNLVYHRLGRKLGGRFNFHLKEHHRDTRRHGGVDPALSDQTWAWDAHGREAFGLLLLVVLHAPLAWLAPWVFGTIVAMAVLYHYCHRRSHRDPEWCRTRLPWHWEHHMGTNPHANYCLTSDWFDRLMGTRHRSPKAWEAPRKAA